MGKAGSAGPKVSARRRHDRWNHQFGVNALTIIGRKPEPSTGFQQLPRIVEIPLFDFPLPQRLGLLFKLSPTPSRFRPQPLHRLFVAPWFPQTNFRYYNGFRAALSTKNRYEIHHDARCCSSVCFGYVGRAEPQKTKADDKAYNAALKSLPDKPFDPWHGVRK
jgi:hypothetical protein